ncbi:MAG: hypothetical protein II867_00450 [Clostridia bacterium]|nr:hypothetical protein [Clostridia bacterium]
MRTKKPRESSKENLFVVGVIVLCFVVTLGLSFIFSGKGFLSLAKVFGKETTRTFYAVTVGGYDDMTLARSTAELVKSRGGAGYVVRSNDDGKDNIEIVFAIYKDKTSAENVLNTIEDRSAYLKEIVVNEPSYSWCEGDVKTAVLNAMEYFDTAFDVMNLTSNSLNDNAMTVEDAKTKIKVLHTQIEDIKSVFYQNTQDAQKSQITEIKLALITTLALLDNVEYSSTAKCASSIRYQLVQLVYCYQSLCSTV